MPVQSFWMNKDLLQWLNENRGEVKLNTAINILIKQQKEADPNGDYLRSILKGYSEVLAS
jgi:endo-beta-N-acetylglucosaminidase D